MKGNRKENLKERYSQDEGRTETKRKERDILIEGAIKRLARNLALEKFPGIHKDDPRAKNLNNSGEVAITGLAL